MKVLPRSREDFPVQEPGSHYYLARRTDAAPVETGGAREKFLFYRGVANVKVPITAVGSADGGVRIARPDQAALGTVILFERRGSQLGFEVRTASDASATLQRPALSNDLGELTTALEQLLVRNGLYEKEAKAMVDTWRDSWFEEGTRVLYTLPEAAVEAMLPLDITPRPATSARVFVGRMEVVTPETRAAVERGLNTRDGASLRRYGRFLAPIAESILTDPAVRITDAVNVRRFVYEALAAAAPAAACRLPTAVSPEGLTASADMPPR